MTEVASKTQNPLKLNRQNAFALETIWHPFSITSTEHMLFDIDVKMNININIDAFYRLLIQKIEANLQFWCFDRLWVLFTQNTMRQKQN